MNKNNKNVPRTITEAVIIIMVITKERTEISVLMHLLTIAIFVTHVVLVVNFDIT